MLDWIKRRQPMAPDPMVALTPLIEVSSAQTESAPSDLDGLLSDYLSWFRQVNGLCGPELRSAADRILELAREIDRLAPGFDWQDLWRQEGVIPLAKNGGLELVHEWRAVLDTPTQVALGGRPSDFIPETLPREAPRGFLDRFGAAAIAGDFGAEVATRLEDLAEHHDRANDWDRVTLRAKFWAAWMAAAREAKERQFEARSIPYLFSRGEEAGPVG
jgi:hypothetical protein